MRVPPHPARPLPGVTTKNVSRHCLVCPRRGGRDAPGGIDIFKLGGTTVFLPTVALPLIPSPSPCTPALPICSVGIVVAEDGAFALGVRRKAKLTLHLTEPLPLANAVAVGNVKKQARLQGLGMAAGELGLSFLFPQSPHSLQGPRVAS